MCDRKIEVGLRVRLLLLVKKQKKVAMIPAVWHVYLSLNLFRWAHDFRVYIFAHTGGAIYAVYGLRLLSSCAFRIPILGGCVIINGRSRYIEIIEKKQQSNVMCA